MPDADGDAACIAQSCADDAVWLINARKAKERVDQRLTESGDELSTEERLKLIVEENVRLQLEHLQEYPFIQVAMQKHNLALHGWVYDMECGAIKVLETV